MRIRLIDALFGTIQLLPLSVEDARAAAVLRASLHRRGRPIGPYDVLLAGSALTRGLCFVTANCREFERVSGLSIENWRVP